MRIKYLATGLASLTLFVCSCSTPKNITYFQDTTPGSVVKTAPALAIRVKPEDKLSISVTTQDPALSSLFNLVRVQQSLNNPTTSATITSASGNNNGQVSLYTVDKEGDINFPVLGKLHIEGMTRAEVAEFIEKKLISRNLVKEPIVSVEFANTGISVLGEVKSPGRYEFNKDRLTIIDAIAMAGDLTITGLRENVAVMRETEDGNEEMYRVNLTDLPSLAASPVFYLQQNDVVYVEPNDKKKRETTASGNTLYTPSFWISLGSFGITIATFIITLTKL